MKTRTTVITLIMLVTSLISNAQNYRNSRYYNPGTGRLDYSQRNYTSRPSSSAFPYSYQGLRIGPTFSTISSDVSDLKASSSHTGVNVGFATGIAMSRYIPVYFESGLYYTQKGGKADKQGNVSFNLGYLEIPLTLKYSIYAAPNVSIQPYAGGYLAYGVNGKIKDYDYETSYNAFGDRTGEFQRFDGGLKVGCGLSFDVLYAEIAYEYGLSDISKNDFGSTHNSSLQLNLGINF